MFQKLVIVLALITIGATEHQNLLSMIKGLLNKDSELSVTFRNRKSFGYEPSPAHEPNVFKKSIQDKVSQKSAYITQFGPMLLQTLYHNTVETGDQLVQNKIQSINDASEKFLSGVKTAGKFAIGIAVKGVQTVSKGVRVIKGIIFKPVFFVVGSKMNLVGGGLTMLGSGTKKIGDMIKGAGKSIKNVGLGGMGSTLIDSGSDSSLDISDSPNSLAMSQDRLDLPFRHDLPLHEITSTVPSLPVKRQSDTTTQTPVNNTTPSVMIKKDEKNGTTLSKPHQSLTDKPESDAKPFNNATQSTIFKKDKPNGTMVSKSQISLTDIMESDQTDPTPFNNTNQSPLIKKAEPIVTTLSKPQPTLSAPKLPDYYH